MAVGEQGRQVVQRQIEIAFAAEADPACEVASRGVQPAALRKPVTETDVGAGGDIVESGVSCEAHAQFDLVQAGLDRSPG